MKPLETAVVCLLVPAVWLTALTRTHPTIGNVLFAVGSGLAVVQLLAGDYRWQMAPAYCLIVVWVAHQVLWPDSARPGLFAGLFAMALLVSAAALSMLLPVFEFPKATGSFPIGSVTLHLIDRQRAEPLAADPGARRELMIQIWYPAETATGKRTRYLPRAATSSKTAQLALVRTHATEGAAMSRRNPRYPVLLFSPSWMGGKAQNTFQVQELASHGFVVAAIDHPYGSNVVVFPDGRIIRTRLTRWLDMSSEEAFQQSARTVEDELRVRSLDVRFALHELRRLNEHDPAGLLTGHLDLERVGVFGHSFGGAVAAQVCWLDTRFRAGINMDGLLFGEAAEEGVRQPFLFMSDMTPVPEADLNSPDPRRQRNARLLMRDALRVERSLTNYGGYSMTIVGAYHMNFSDSPLFSPLKRFTSAGPIGADRAMKLINRYTLAFFELYLNGVHRTLLDGPSPENPDVRFRNWMRHEK